jgi:hypothetical protein
MNEDHRQALELLSLPGEILTPDERSWLVPHLRGCEACARAADALRAVGETISSEADAPPGLVARTGSAVRTRIAQREHARTVERGALLAAALTMLVLGAYALLARWTIVRLGYSISPAAFWGIVALLGTLCSLVSLGAAVAVRPLEGESVPGDAGGAR